MTVAGALAGGEPMDLSGSHATLEQLVDQQHLQELLDSFYGLFRIPLRVVNERGGSFARSHQQTALGELLARSARASAQLRQLQASLQTLDPGASGEKGIGSFSGTSYHVIAVGHDGRRLGRAILGPFLSPGQTSVPRSLFEAAPDLDPEQLGASLLQLPRVKPETVHAIARHLVLTLDVLLFTGQRLMLAEGLQLATLRDGERRLSEVAGQLELARGEAHQMRRRHAATLGRLARRVTGALEAVVALGDASPAGDSLLPGSGPWSAVRSSAESVRDTLLPLHAFESDELSRERFDPSRLLRAVEQELAPLAAQRRLDLRARSGGSLPELSADFQRLKAALVHIAEGALRSAPAGGEVQVLARPLFEDEGGSPLLAEPRLTGIELRVTDNGRSMSPSEREAALEAFVVSSSADGAGRDGLGLALARHHVELHGGRLTIEDHRPVGVAVVVTLPLEPGAGSR